MISVFYRHNVRALSSFVVLGVTSQRALFDRLPPYLALQFVRFFWKAGVDKKPGNKSKITRPVEFPHEVTFFSVTSIDLRLIDDRSLICTIDAQRRCARAA